MVLAATTCFVLCAISDDIGCCNEGNPTTMNWEHGSCATGAVAGVQNQGILDWAKDAKRQDWTASFLA